MSLPLPQNLRTHLIALCCVLFLTLSAGSAAHANKRGRKRSKSRPPATEVLPESELSADDTALAEQDGSTNTDLEDSNNSDASALTAEAADDTDDTDDTDDDGGTTKEEFVDFEAEEIESDAQTKRIIAEAGGGDSSKSAFGFKLFVDLVADHRVGEKSFQFRPNHTYVILQTTLAENMQLLFHVSDSPIFWELQYNLTPEFALLLGKLFVPFGTNEFHHLIGGRVDELSHFLPESWGDYGVGIKHSVLDTRNAALEYVLYAVNGFSGTEKPNISAGAPTDNNWAKGLGTRVRATLFRNLTLTGSAYYDIWDDENKHQMLFYALGAEVRPGAFRDIPVLRRMFLRGEWARGEIQLPGRNHQQGILKEFAYARSGYYGEVNVRLVDSIMFRMRAGRINPDNTVTDKNDVEVYEPALLVGVGKKVWWTLAYQATAGPGLDYDSNDPADLVYGKLFIVY